MLKLCYNFVMDIDYLLKKTARTLYLSSKFMPKAISKTFGCAYLICRAADSIADTDLIDVEKRISLINTYPKLVETKDENLLAELKNSIPKKNNLHENEKLLLENIDICLQQFKTLKPLHKQITLKVVNAVCKAMEWDLSYFPDMNSGLIKASPNAARTELYCQHMGGEPGIFWASLLLDGKDNKDFIQDGKRIGMALQITNILRDLPQDVKIGRIYLPLTELTANEIMPQDLMEKKIYKKLKPVILKWINWGTDNIVCAKYFMASIPRRKFFERATVAWPVLWSLDTLKLLASCKNLLDKTKIQKIPKKTIYLTMLLSPFYCFSNTVFNKLIDKKIKSVKEELKLQNTKKTVL